MDIIHLLLRFLLATGASWVLWLLIILSVVSIGVMMERAYGFSKFDTDVDALKDNLRRHLSSGEIKEAIFRLELNTSSVAQIALEGLKSFAKGADSVAEAIASAKASQKVRLEQNLAILGTLGNNAPFIGLLGTVIGIIKAFHDLSTGNANGGAKVVMAGISEALVATAMGLFVAIPAVLAYNYFQRRARIVLTNADGLSHFFLAELRKTNGNGKFDLDTKPPSTQTTPEPA